MYHIYKKFVRVFCNVKKMFTIESISFSSLKFFQRSFLNFLRMNIKHTHASVRAANNHYIYNQHFVSKSKGFHGLWNSGIFCCISFTIIQYHGLIQFSITFCLSIKLLYQNHKLHIGTFGIPNIPVLIIYYIKELNEVVLNVGRTKMENRQEQPKTDITTMQQNEVIFYNQCKQ